MELIGLLLPALIDVVNLKFESSTLRFWVSALICAVVGIFLNWIETSFIFATAQMGFDSITTSIMATFGIAQLSYKAIWEKSDIRAKMIGQPKP